MMNVQEEYEEIKKKLFLMAMMIWQFKKNSDCEMKNWK